MVSVFVNHSKDKYFVITIMKILIFSHVNNIKYSLNYKK